VKDKVTIEIQYFKDCPNSKELISRIKKAMEEIDEKTIYFETLVEDNISAEKVKFRGSPTLLIDGADFENLSEPTNPNLSCRYYHNGLPTIEEIQNKILLQIEKRSDNEN
jgi:hypothetical protein